MAKKKMTPRPKKLTEFTLFPKLAPELRNMVWELARPGPNLVTIKFTETALDEGKIEVKLGASYNIPTMLAVNKEARSIILKSYNAAFKKNLDGKIIYFDFKRDGLIFDTETAMSRFYGFSSWDMLSRAGPALGLEKKLLLLGFKEVTYGPGYCAAFLSHVGRPEHVSFIRKTGNVPWRHTYRASLMETNFEREPVGSEEAGDLYKKPDVSYTTMKSLQVRLNEINDPTLIKPSKPKTRRSTTASRRSTRIDGQEFKNYAEVDEDGAPLPTNRHRSMQGYPYDEDNGFDTDVEEYYGYGMGYGNNYGYNYDSDGEGPCPGCGGYH